MVAPILESDPHRMQQEQEKSVGISTFVRPDAPGFSCIVKQRYTDFLVNEILPTGKILHLTELGSDKEKKRKREPDAELAQKKLKFEENSQNGNAQGSESKPIKQEDIEIKPDVPIKDEDAGIKSEPAIKEEPVETKPEALTATANQRKAEAIATIADADRTTLKDVFGEATTTAIIDLYASVIAFPDRKPRDHPTVNSPPIAEKSKRTEAHICVRKIFKSKLETLTVQDQDHVSGPGTIISVKAAPPKAAQNPNSTNRNGEQQRGKQNWAELGGDYLHFTLYKENKDTMEVLYFIASQLKMAMKHFGFAGTKDRRGVTVQRVCAHRVKRERIEGLNKLARGFRLGGPWEYKTTGLELGMLGGNQFMLTLRDVHTEDEPKDGDIEARLKHVQSSVEAAARNLNESGYLNYYGLQRFGTHSTGTHAIGMQILQGNLEGAVDSILSYDPALLEHQQSNGSESGASSGKKVPQDDINRAKAIHAFRKSGTSAEALSYLPGSRFSAEKALITYLGKKDRQTGKNTNATDHQGALSMIQRNLRLMYVHAYQSFVWNTVAGKRWEMHGAKVVEGDLVVVGEKERAEGVANGNNRPAEEVDEHGEPIVHPSASAGYEAAPSVGEVDDPFVRARPLSREEAESGRFSVFDLVLPLPGFDVIYPQNELGKFLEDFMASEQGGGLDPHNMRRAWKDISLSGGYRKMMARPLGAGVQVEVKAYSGIDEQMVQTDLEKLEKLTKTEPQDESAPENGPDAGLSGKDKLAVILKLQLGSSQYATMALRELTKGGASSFTPNYSVTNR